LSGVFRRKGGADERNTAWLTLFDPYFPKQRATSPPPIEKPASAKSRSSSCVTNVCRSAAKTCFSQEAPLSGYPWIRTTA
jgi:hypothetical protein